MADHTDYLVEETQTDFRTIGKTSVTGRATGLSASLRKTPAVGDAVNDLYEVEASLGDKRFTVLHRTLDERFELRLLRNVTAEALDASASSASLANHSNLGVVVDARTCPTFGLFGVIAQRRGLELSDVLDDGMHSIDGALRFAIAIGSALATLHENGIVHGMRDFRDIVCGSDGEWILCAAGLPALSGAVAPVVAPESRSRGDVSPASDQWVLAAAIYQMLCGKPAQPDTMHGPGKRRPGVPKAVDDALVRALSAEPASRFPEIDEFVDALRASFFVWRQPSMVPVDAREISRLLKMHPDVAAGFDRGKTRQSVVVRVADLKSSKPTLQLSYQNIARLRREYRHNLAHGGIFVPTPTPPAVGNEATVVLSLGDDDDREQVMLNGVISHVTEGDDDTPPGAGVVFDAESLSRLTSFIRSVGVLQRLPANSVITRNENFVELDRLSADGLFMLSLILRPIAVGELRSDCASMPFDFDETLAALIDAGALTQVAHDAPDPGENNAPTDVDYELGAEDIYSVLELIDFHYERRALIGAAAVARQNERFFQDEARLHFRAARIWSDGLHELGLARRYIRKTLVADPTRREYEDMKRRIEALIQRDAIRKIYARDFPVTDVHFVGWDAEERTAWVMTTSQLQPDRARVLGIDVRRDTIRHSETYPYALEVHPVWSSRTSLGEPPALFRGSARPCVVSHAGDWVFDRSPTNLEAGVFVLDPQGELTTVYEGESWDVEVSHDGVYVSWVAHVGDQVGVFVSKTRDPAPENVFETDGAVRCFWARRGHKLAVYVAATGEIWRVSPDGAQESVGTQREMFDDIIADASGETVAVVYQKPGVTELQWLNVGEARVRAQQPASAPVRQLVVRSDGCFVATTDTGTLLGSFARGTDHHIKGLRLVPACMQHRDWLPGRPFVGMVYRQNALELVELNPDLLLA